MSPILNNIIYPKPIHNINNSTTTNTTNSYTIKYINGGISGMCGIVLSHPIDNIKTYIQTGNKLNSFKPSLQIFIKVLVHH